MKDKKDVVVKPVPVRAMKPITRAVRDIDTMQGKIDVLGNTKFDLMLALANLVLESRKPRAKIAGEHKRLMAYARAIVLADGFTAHHDRNIWSGVANIMLQKMAGDKVITTKAGKNDKGKPVTAKVKASALPMSARAVADNAREVKASLGMGDKRANNTPKTRTPRTVDTKAPNNPTTTGAQGWVESIGYAVKQVKTTKLVCDAVLHHFGALQKQLLSMGYVITLEKKEVTKAVKPAKKTPAKKTPAKKTAAKKTAAKKKAPAPQPTA